MRRRAHPGPKRRIERPRQLSWLSIRVELVEGRGERYWPHPGRLFAASKSHSFSQLATAIDDAFARWDRSHIHEFQLSDGTRLGIPDPDFDEIIDDGSERLARLQLGEEFTYVFDLGDDWTHHCTVGTSAIDPVQSLGVVAEVPTSYFGWGAIPDQYGRRWSEDDGESEPPPDPDPRNAE
jgi:hypothetical protein